MSGPIRLTAAISAILLSSGVAQAASLVTSPLNGEDTSTVICSIQYIGTSTTAIPVLITMKEGSSIIRRDNNARLNVSRPSYSIGGTCSQGRFNICADVICAFSFTADKSLFRASACIRRGVTYDNSQQMCMPAY